MPAGNPEATVMNYLYLHGFCSGPGSFKGQYLKEKFARKNLVLQTPDLNGADFTYLTLTAQLAIVEKICRENPGPWTLLGSSMGAYLAALFAEDHPEVHKVVMIAPAFQFAQRRLLEMPGNMLAAWRKSGFIQVFHHAYQEERPLHIGIIEDAGQYDRRPLSRQLPALLIHGLEDETVDYRLSIGYVAQHSQARLILLKGDHQLTGESHPETIWQQIQLFLNLGVD